MVEYSALQREDTWVEYLRTRLPYSFREIRKQGHDRYILSGPLLTTGLAEYHNFWKRGYVYYVVGRLIDVQKLSLYWREYRIVHTDRLRNKCSATVDRLSKWPADVFNAIQLEKLWALVADDHLDRERVVMTNVVQAIEFCLKAIKTHAEYRHRGVFAFDDGHNLEKIYRSLPGDLRLEMQAESVKFAENYAAFRKAIEDRVSQLTGRFGPPNVAGADVGAWENIASETERATYTAFVGVNDPPSASAMGCKPEEWFDRAMRGIGEITYHRYSPFQGRDEYPVMPIHLGLMLGRFMYEHLFPILGRGEKEK